MSLPWYLNRLRAMGPAEVAHRALEAVRKTSARSRREGWHRYADRRPVVPVIPGFAARMEACGPGVRERVAACSGPLLNGKFSALGVDWPKREPDDLFPNAFWHLDPLTGSSWDSASYCFDVDYRHQARLGDVKYAWEFNRLQHLQPLAAQFFFTGNRSAIEAIEAAVESWYNANPPYRGVAWASGIELALRIVSLLVVTSLCGEHLSSATISRIRTALRAHSYWLSRYPSLHSSANNHRVAELAAGYLLTLAMPEVASPEDQARLGAKLSREAQRQILADGVSAEQSPSYGALTAEWLLLAESAGQAALPDVRSRLCAFAEWVAWMSDDKGNVPNIGDNDECRVLAVHEDDRGYVRTVAHSICAFYGLPAAANLAASVAHFRASVFGVEGDAATSPAGRRTFHLGGYSVLRERIGGREICLTYDHGPLGYLSIAAHGHADALSLTLSVGGLPLLVDPGTYLYHPAGEWRDWFRGTRAHNTLNVAGQNQSIISGAFNWSDKASAKPQEVEHFPQWRVLASHDGYRKRFGVTHEREVLHRGNELLILDRLTGSDRAFDCEVVFQLGAGFGIRQVNSAVIVTRGGEFVAEMLFDQSGVVAVACGEEGVSGGWVSESFGVRTPAWRISWNGQVGSAAVPVRIRLVEAAA